MLRRPTGVRQASFSISWLRAERDTEWYPTGVKITDTEMDALPLTRHDWHGDWNYTLAATSA